VPGRAEFSIGNQGIFFPSVSTGKTTDPSKGVGDGIGVAVAVDSGVDVGGMGEGVNVGGMGEGVSVGGTGVEAGAHPLKKTVSDTNARNTD
jgi:hypothetical protein